MTHGKESAYNAGDSGSIPELGRSSGEGNGYLLQYPCLENSMDRKPQPMGSQKVRYDWTCTCAHTHTHIEMPDD